jgi:hypothetical protein
MTRRPRESRASRNGNRCRLSHQSIWDLQTWGKLASTETEGCPIRLLPTNGTMHTDAADVGFGGTLDIAGNPGDPGHDRTKRCVSEYPTSNRCDEHDGRINVIRVNCIVAGVRRFGD